MIARQNGFSFYLVLFLCLAAVNNTIAAPTTYDVSKAVQPNGLVKVELGSYIDYLQDAEVGLTLDEILDKSLGLNWQLSTQASINHGVSSSVYWFRFELQEINRVDSDLELLLFSDRFDHLQFYQQDGSGQWITIDTRENDRLLGEEIDNALILPILDDGNHLREFYLRVEFNGPSALPLFLMNEKAKKQLTKNRQYLLGGYYGIMLVMMLYNLFLYISTRSKSYATYVTYIVSLTLFMAHADGILTQPVWDGDARLNATFLAFFSACTIVFTCNFARVFLQLSDRAPLVNMALLGIMGSSLGLAVSAFLFPFAIIMNIVLSIVLVVTVLMIAVSFHLYQSGYKDTRFFLIAWAGFLLGTFTSSAMWMGLLPWAFPLQYAIHCGSFFEVVLLSLALADRINTYQMEKEQVEAIAKEKLEKKNNELMLGNRLKDEFLATISHELRTPMNGVVGALELLDVSELDHGQQCNVDAGTRSARDMMRLIDDLLGFSELQSGSYQMDLEVFELKQALLQLHAKFLGQSALKGIQFEFSVDDRLPSHWKADKGRMMLIIYHLLENAIKFTEKGSVLFAIKPCDNPKTTVEAKRFEELENDDADFQWVEISVKDTGIGISKEKISEIFSAFLQVDGSYARKYGGLGIGLAICKKTVNLLGGEIRVESEKGRGSKFTVKLPLLVADYGSAELSAQKKEVVELPVNLQGRVQALVVEDNQVNQKVLRGILKKLGCEVATADNGKQAIETMRDQSFDVIFMDCQMPVMDGFEATKRIRQSNTSNSTVPIIAVTANVLSSDRERCLKAGMNDYIKKPVKLAQIKDALFLVLRKNAA